MSTIADILLASMRPAEFLSTEWLKTVVAKKCPRATEHEIASAFMELAVAGLATSEDGGLSFCR
jgi:hypothetical protein